MHIRSNFHVSSGQCLPAEPIYRQPPPSADRAALARRIDREADLALAVGDGRLADLLAWKAAGLREPV